MLALQDSGWWVWPVWLRGCGGGTDAGLHLSHCSGGSCSLLGQQLGKWLQSSWVRRLTVWVPTTIAKNATAYEQKPMRKRLPGPHPIQAPPSTPCSSLRPEAWKASLRHTPRSLGQSPARQQGRSPGTCRTLLASRGAALPDRPSGSRLTGAAEVSWFYFQQTCFVYSNLFPLSFWRE